MSFFQRISKSFPPFLLTILKQINPLVRVFLFSSLKIQQVGLTFSAQVKTF